MSKVSLRYARALSTACGKESKQIRELSAQLSLAAEVLATREVQNFFTNPRIKKNLKAKAIEKSFTAAEPALVNLLKIVVRNNKVAEIANIAKDFETILAENSGFIRAKIETANKLDSKLLEKIVSALEKLTGREIQTESSLNPNLLGGIKITLGNDEVIDLSLRNKLNKLSKALTT
jgi:F-type H+-transporting ATPase subunit delta